MVAMEMARTSLLYTIPHLTKNILTSSNVWLTGPAKAGAESIPHFTKDLVGALIMPEKSTKAGQVDEAIFPPSFLSGNSTESRTGVDELNSSV